MKWILSLFALLALAAGFGSLVLSATMFGAILGGVFVVAACVLWVGAVLTDRLDRLGRKT